MKRNERKRVRFATEYGCGSLKLVVPYVKSPLKLYVKLNKRTY